MPFRHPGGSLCNGANKLYVLRTQLHTGKVLEIAKAKGMTKYDKDGKPLFKWNDYEAMHHPTDPKPLTCSQTQFKLGMSGYCRDGDGVRLFIGAENPLFSLSGSSVIVAPYMNSDQEIIGALGVIGPTRLNYARVIPLVDYTARVVGQILDGTRS